MESKYPPVIGKGGKLSRKPSRIAAILRGWLGPSRSTIRKRAQHGGTDVINKALDAVGIVHSGNGIEVRKKVHGIMRSSSGNKREQLTHILGKARARIFLFRYRRIIRKVEKVAK